MVVLPYASGIIDDPAVELLPFVIETGGAWGLDACNLFHQCKSRLADSSGGARGVGEYSGDGFPVDLATWSANGFSAFHRQCVSVSLQRGLGDFVRASAGVCRGEVTSGAAFGVGPGCGWPPRAA